LLIKRKFRNRFGFEFEFTLAEAGDSVQLQS